MFDFGLDDLWPCLVITRSLKPVHLWVAIWRGGGESVLIESGTCIREWRYVEWEE